MSIAPTQPHPWWKPVWKLVVEVWVGSALFAILFAPAVGLDLVVNWLKTSSGAKYFPRCTEASWLSLQPP